jgi:hypothetical protein
MFAKNRPMKAKSENAGPANKYRLVIELEEQLACVLRQHIALNKRLEWRVKKDLLKLTKEQLN